MLRFHGPGCASYCRSLHPILLGFTMKVTNLKVAVSDVHKFDFVVEGAETIARSISRFAILEIIYLRPQTLLTQSSKALEEALVRLYTSILVYLARAKQYYEQSTASMSCLRPSA